MKNNVFVIDSISKKVVTRIKSDNPKETAEKEALGYFEKGEGKPKHKSIPSEKYPNRFGILTPTDYFIHYFV